MVNHIKNFQQKKQYPILTYLKDKSKFLEFWKIIHSLKFYKYENSQQSNQISQLIINLLWINNQNDGFFNILNIITPPKKKLFLQAVELIEDEINQQITDYNDMNILKMNFLRIIYAQYPEEESNYFLLRNLITNYGSLLRASMILQASKFLNNKLNEKSIQFFAKFGIKFIVVHKIFPNQTLSKLAQDILNYMSSNIQLNTYECLIILKSIFAIKQVDLSEDLQFISILIENFCTKLLGYLIIINNNKYISLTQVKWTIYAIFNLFQKIAQPQFLLVEKCIVKLFKDKSYNFPFVFNCLRNKISFEKIQTICIYFLKQN